MDYSLLLGIESVDQSRLLDTEYKTSLVSPLSSSNLTLQSSCDDHRITQKHSKASVIHENSILKQFYSVFDQSAEDPSYTCVKNFYGDYYLHFSIIDYLQKWNLNKKLERFSKTVFLNKDGEKLSAIEPNKYAKRFVNFMEDKLFNH